MEVDIRKYDLHGFQLGQYKDNKRLLTLEVISNHCTQVSIYGAKRSHITSVEQSASNHLGFALPYYLQTSMAEDIYVQKLSFRYCRQHP